MFRIIFVTISILSIGNFVFQICCSDTVVFLYYGFDPSIIDNGSFEAFRAAEVTYSARHLLFKIGFVTQIAWLCASFFAIYLRVMTKYFFNWAMFLLSWLLTAFYIIAFNIPKGGL